MAGNIVTDRIQTDTSYASSLAIETNGAERLRIDSSGNLGFISSGARITGDFSNATIANRVLFQSSTTNGNTRIGLIPNGTSQISSINLHNSVDPANSSFLSLASSSAESQISSGITGTGTYLPMTFYTGGGSERMRIDASGNVSIGTTSSTTKLYVAGSAASNNYTLTDAATITPDFSQSNNFTITLGGNRTMANATNMTVGQSGVMYITQDGTGSRTLAWGTAWDWPNGGVPTLTTTASAVDVIVYTVRTSTSIVAQLIPNIG